MRVLGLLLFIGGWEYLRWHVRNWVFSRGAKCSAHSLKKIKKTP